MDIETADTAELISILEWYRAAGVDVAVGDMPIDRFAQVRPPAAVPQRSIAPPIETAPLATAVLAADPADTSALAATARTLAELEEIVRAYDGCALKARATQLCFADGNPEADVMLVGEGPGGEEDRIGKPFVGRAGQLLDRMLGSIGLDRSAVYIANTVPWRPPGNRNPTPQEIALCLPFLQRQIELVQPRILVAVGAVAAQSLFGATAGISRLRGQWRDITIGTHPVRAIAMLHPAYLLRVPSQKAQAWRDMLELKRAVEATSDTAG